MNHIFLQMWHIAFLLRITPRMQWSRKSQSTQQGLQRSASGGGGGCRKRGTYSDWKWALQGRSLQLMKGEVGGRWWSLGRETKKTNREKNKKKTQREREERSRRNNCKRRVHYWMKKLCYSPRLDDVALSERPSEDQVTEQDAEVKSHHLQKKLQNSINICCPK